MEITEVTSSLQIKIGSVKLAKKYMKRVAMELQAKGASEKDSAMDYMLLQGVRFAFRIHQVCYIRLSSIFFMLRAPDLGHLIIKG